MQHFMVNELRDNLVILLKQKGIHSPEVLKAIGNVPRHLFIDQHIFSTEDAYRDIPLPIGQGQTISQPFTVAYQTQLLNLKKGAKILEIGTGSGYQAAVLAEMQMHVYTVERQRKLYERTKELFDHLNYKIQFRFGDGNDGWEEHAPYDGIIVTAAAPEIPPQLIKQLKIGGVMVVPIDGNIQKMTRVIKTSSTEIDVEEFDYFQFVPLLPGTNK